MFHTEQFYEAKVFLKSYTDAIECIKYNSLLISLLYIERQTAQKEEEVAHYERIMHRIIEAKKNDEVDIWVILDIDNIIRLNSSMTTSHKARDSRI